MFSIWFSVNIRDRQAVREDNGTAFVEYSRAFGPDFGITLCGEMDKNGFHQEYYFPYFRGTGVTSREDLMVEKHGSQESFARASWKMPEWVFL